MGIVIAYLFGFVLSAYTGLHMTGSLLPMMLLKAGNCNLQNLILPAITLE